VAQDGLPPRVNITGNAIGKETPCETRSWGANLMAGERPCATRQSEVKKGMIEVGGRVSPEAASKGTVKPVGR